jgi:hypothetical protein
MYLTVNDVKQDLPNIPVLIKGIEYTGCVRGRFNKYPVVYVHILTRSAEFTWEAVQRAYNTGEPLKF